MPGLGLGYSVLSKDRHRIQLEINGGIGIASNIYSSGNSAEMPYSFLGLMPGDEIFVVADTEKKEPQPWLGAGLEYTFLISNSFSLRGGVGYQYGFGSNAGILSAGNYVETLNQRKEVTFDLGYSRFGYYLGIGYHF